VRLASGNWRLPHLQDGSIDMAKGREKGRKDKTNHDKLTPKEKKERKRKKKEKEKRRA